MHVLVVGATGMLNEATVTFIHRGCLVTTVSRSHDRAKALKSLAKFPEHVNTLVLDWHHGDHLIKEVTASSLKFGPIDQVVLWMHSDAQHAMNKLLERIEAVNMGETWELYHIKGSSASRPEKNWKPRIPENCQYHDIILGFKKDSEHSRWLTNAEISQGVIEAVFEKTTSKIIGTVEPWSQRPGW